MADRLLRSGMIVSFMTLISRILGLVRDVVIANLMGAGAAADVFFFANKIPNFLRRLFAEGAFAQAFVPVLTEVHQNQTAQQQKEFIAKVSGTLGAIVFLTAMLGVIGSPVIAALFGAGWFIEHLNGQPDGEKFELAALMLKITFPYLAFVSLVGVSGAILNTLNKFAVAAFTPVLLNIAIIGCAIYLAPQLDQPAFALAWGVFFGGITQLLFQLPFLWQAGCLVRPRWGWNHPGVTKVRLLMIPALFGVSVSQINLLLDTFIASFLGTGPISWLYYSDRLLEFPLGLFGIAIATVILPALSRDHVNQNQQKFAHNMDWAVRMVCFLGIPAATGLFVLAQPILMVIFQRGAFTAETSQMASYSLMAYAFGLLSFMLVKVLAPGFFSRQDMKTPVKFGIITMAANMLFNLILVFPFDYVGLAIATSLSAALNAAMLYAALHKQGVFKLSMASLMFVVKVVLSSLCMAVFMYWHSSILWSQYNEIERIVELGKQISLAVTVFVLSIYVLGIRFKDFRNGKASQI